MVLRFQRAYDMSRYIRNYISKKAGVQKDIIDIEDINDIVEKIIDEYNKIPPIGINKERMRIVAERIVDICSRINVAEKKTVIEAKKEEEEEKENE